MPRSSLLGPLRVPRSSLLRLLRVPRTRLFQLLMPPEGSQKARSGHSGDPSGGSIWVPEEPRRLEKCTFHVFWGSLGHPSTRRLSLFGCLGVLGMPPEGSQKARSGHSGDPSGGSIWAPGTPQEGSIPSIWAL